MSRCREPKVRLERHPHRQAVQRLRQAYQKLRQSQQAAGLGLETEPNQKSEKVQEVLQ